MSKMNKKWQKLIKNGNILSKITKNWIIEISYIIDDYQKLHKGIWL